MRMFLPSNYLKLLLLINLGQSRVHSLFFHTVKNIPNRFLYSLLRCLLQSWIWIQGLRITLNSSPPSSPGPLPTSVTNDPEDYCYSKIRPMYFNVPKTLCIKVGTVVYRRYYVMDVKPKTQTISSASTTSEDHPREVSKRSLKSPSIRVLPQKYRSWIGQEKLE